MIEVTGSLAVAVGPFGHFAAFGRPIYYGPGGGMSWLKGAIDKSGNDEMDKEKLIQQFVVCLATAFSNAI